MKNENLLTGAIESGFLELADLKTGSPEYKEAVDSLAKLMDRAIEIEKLNRESDEKSRKRLDDLETKQNQIDDSKRDRWICNGINIASILIPSLITIWGTVKTFQFEEKGTITTSVGRIFIGKLFNRR